MASYPGGDVLQAWTPKHADLFTAIFADVANLISIMGCVEGFQYFAGHEAIEGS